MGWFRKTSTDDAKEKDSAVGFVPLWFTTRNYHDLLLGTPAVVAALVLVITAYLAFSPIEEETAEAYRQRALAASEQGQERLASLYLRKSAKLSATDSPATRFRRGLALHRAGQVEDAMAIIQPLAPEDSPGFRPAHEWLVSVYSEQHGENLRIKEPSEDQLNERRSLLEKVEAHCRQLLEFDQQHAGANRTLALICLARGETEAAMEHYDNVSDVDEGVRVIYARLLASQGRNAEAERQARAAVDFHQAALAGGITDPQLAGNHRLQLAAAHKILKEYQAACNVLLVDGKPPQTAAHRNMLASVFIAAADEQDGKNNNTNVLRRMNLLERALQLVPNHPQLVLRIGEMCSADGEAGDRAVASLKRILATGHASWIAHFSLGVRANQDGDLAAAETHFEQAYRINPDILITLNNLAFMLAHREEPDFERAIELIEKAIAKQPNNPEFRDTRGAILVKMERWDDAITDFEYSLKRLPGRPKTHLALADAYQAKGDSELAEIHRGRAKALQEKKDAPNQGPDSEG
jgi:tetratricopeptide (TPR) repeat protein